MWIDFVPLLFQYGYHVKDKDDNPALFYLLEKLTADLTQLLTYEEIECIDALILHLDSLHVLHTRVGMQTIYEALEPFVTKKWSAHSDAFRNVYRQKIYID